MLSIFHGLHLGSYNRNFLKKLFVLSSLINMNVTFSINDFSNSNLLELLNCFCKLTMFSNISNFSGVANFFLTSNNSRET